MFPRAKDGDHVVAVRDVSSPFGASRIRKGSRGMVVGPPTGIFDVWYQVEFAPGGTTRVRAGDLRRATFGHGPEAFRRYRIGRRVLGTLLIVVVGVPILLLVLSRKPGWSLSEWVVATLLALVELSMNLVSMVGLLVTPCVICLVWLARRSL